MHYTIMDLEGVIRRGSVIDISNAKNKPTDIFHFLVCAPFYLIKCEKCGLYDQCKSQLNIRNSIATCASSLDPIIEENVNKSMQTVNSENKLQEPVDMLDAAPLNKRGGKQNTLCKTRNGSITTITEASNKRKSTAMTKKKSRNKATQELNSTSNQLSYMKPVANKRFSSRLSSNKSFTKIVTNKELLDMFSQLKAKKSLNYGQKSTPNKEEVCVSNDSRPISSNFNAVLNEENDSSDAPNFEESTIAKIPENRKQPDNRRFSVRLASCNTSNIINSKMQLPPIAMQLFQTKKEKTTTQKKNKKTTTKHNDTNNESPSQGNRSQINARNQKSLNNLNQRSLNSSKFNLTSGQKLSKVNNTDVKDSTNRIKTKSKTPEKELSKRKSISKPKGRRFSSLVERNSTQKIIDKEENMSLSHTTKKDNARRQKRNKNDVEESKLVSINTETLDGSHENMKKKRPRRNRKSNKLSSICIEKPTNSISAIPIKANMATKPKSRIPIFKTRLLPPVESTLGTTLNQNISNSLRQKGKTASKSVKKSKSQDSPDNFVPPLKSTSVKAKSKPRRKQNRKSVDPKTALLTNITKGIYCNTTVTKDTAKTDDADFYESVDNLMDNDSFFKNTTNNQTQFKRLSSLQPHQSILPNTFYNNRPLFWTTGNDTQQLSMKLDTSSVKKPVKRKLRSQSFRDSNSFTVDK